MAKDNRTFDVLITAGEAYPRLEQEFLRARDEIRVGFRVFDPWTTLRSEQAQAVGQHWFDLVVDTLNRGVTLWLTLTDFDPVVRLDMHFRAWSAFRALVAAGQASRHPENLHVNVDMHPARVGLLPRLALWPRTYRELKDALSDLVAENDLTADQLRTSVPRLADLVRERGNHIVPRRFPPLPLVPVTHHQKLAVFDGETLYIGGLDLDNRRFDTPDHDRPGDETWHDVQVVVSGAAAQDARQHLMHFSEIADGAAPEPLPHLLRTVSARRAFDLPFLSPQVRLSEVAHAHLAAIARSETLIYLETQFFRDEEVARALCDRKAEQPGLSLIVVLPAAPEDIAFKDDPGSDARFGEHLQAQCVARVRQAFGTDAAFLAPALPRPVRRGTSEDATPRAAHFGAPLVYLHAKVSLFDDHTGIVSSANLNGRSLKWDTEAGIKTHNESEVSHLRDRCFAHWLGDSAAGAEYFALSKARHLWTLRARQNAMLSPQDRAGFLLPYDVEAGAADGQILPGVPSEMV